MPSRRKPRPSIVVPVRNPRSKARVWVFRLLALGAVPVVFFVLLELGLRLAGFGNSSGFLRPEKLGAREVFIHNDRVAVRFLGKEMARTPEPFLIDRKKPEGTVRIVVFGESAAFGDPQPEAGPARVLRVLLERRYPGTRFEVINAALTGINSHAILPIARDWKRGDADIWVVCMGNNEVVGPYGAGTVFGPQVPALGLIRSGVALKGTRTGQWLETLRDRWNPPASGRAEWGGMEMFLEQRVTRDDPRMATVHRHFRRNLADLLAAARRADVKVVLTTMAVNLRDSAPFASEHRAGLSDGQRAAWRERFEAGQAAARSGDMAKAIAAWREALAVDDAHAETHFVLGHALLAAGQGPEALDRFSDARDLDALRFRCDSRLNQAIRDAAAAGPEVFLADAETVFNQASPGGVAGNDYFHEHVHFRLQGAWLLARTWAEQVARCLPPEIVSRAVADMDWAPAEECARALAWTDWSRWGTGLMMLGRLTSPPFTGQSGNAGQVAALRREIETLAPAARPEAVRQLEPLFREALAAAPGDAVLAEVVSRGRLRAGDLEGAVEAARRVTELNPFDTGAWQELGIALSKAGKNEEAVAAFEEALRRDPDNLQAATNLGQALAALNRSEEAVTAFRRALALKPRFGQAHLDLGRVLETLGLTNEAQGHFEQALRFRILTPDGLAALARFSHARGWHSAAATNFADALRLNPSDPELHLHYGRALAAAGRGAESGTHYREALRLNPLQPEAQFLVGLELGRGGDEEGALRHFREAARLRPDFLEARINLGVALRNLGRPAEALAEFEAALKLDPANAVARRSVTELRAQSDAAPTGR